ncbi:hypothetical protein [Moorena sp. SIO3H5]|uniref:hypothetical protein n=1 Tax=Moorena sp. SIO3H5 TaxID=2607834 RepID=UPI0013B7B2FA|nr:hypothetical protein [Moorena sp. SIO3H5]NEO71071.1 hypothetical protein [Moorena sp. SIO3H5]
MPVPQGGKSNWQDASSTGWEIKLARCQFHRVGNQTGKMPVPRLMSIPSMAQTAKMR